MQASSVSVSQIHSSGLSRGTGMLGVLLLTGATLLATAPQARADDGQIIFATGLGAIAGALIGQSVGGRSGTIVGSVVGAAIGANAATEGNRYRSGRASGYGYYEDGYATIEPVVYAPPVQVYRRAQAYQPMYQPVYRTVVRPVVYPVVYRGGYDGYYDSDDRRDVRGWDRERYDRRYDRDGNGYEQGGRSWDSDRNNSGYRR